MPKSLASGRPGRPGPRPCLLVALALAAPAFAGLAPCAAQPPAVPDLHPLVKFHDAHILDAGPAVVSSTDKDVFVARGGALVSVSVSRQILRAGSFQTEIAQGTGTAHALAALNAALAAGRAGSQSGTCSAELLPLGSTFSFTVTWFGVHNRSTSFTLTNEGGATSACTPDQIAIAEAILSFESSVLADPATSIQRSSCAVSADCAAGQLCCPSCAVPGCAKQCTAPVQGRCPLLP